MEKTKQRARDFVYWPRLNTDIESLIARVSICQDHQREPQNEPTDSETIPDGGRGSVRRHAESSTQHRVPNIIQSNGLAEKAMQTAKRIIMKASGLDPYIALLEYRTMPI